MTTIYHTKKINQKAYDQIIKNTIIFNGHDGTHLSGQVAWAKFDAEWTLEIIPLTDAIDPKYSSYFKHVEVNTNTGIPWGITGKKTITVFVTDTRNPFILRQNVMPLAHELLHAVYQDNVGTYHITRKYNSPEGKAGTRGAAQTVIVHDNWYGSKETLKFWIRYGVIWLPITIPYCPIKKAKEEYPI
jgi:hypothetical protein